MADHPGREIHVVLDNLNTRKPKDNRWLKRIPAAPVILLFAAALGWHGPVHRAMGVDSALALRHE